jgi:hypothetical protein
MTSYQTSPVNTSAGPLVLGCFGWISNCRPFVTMPRVAPPRRLGAIVCVRCICLVELVERRRPVGEEGQRVRGSGAGFRAVDVHPQTWVRRQIQRLVRQVDVADEG